MNRSLAGMAAFALALGGCASMSAKQSSSTGNPTAQRTEAAQQESQDALNQASAAQKKAADQARKASEAQQQVQQAQLALTKAEANARQQEQKARQLQEQANLATQQASRVTQQYQAQASQALAQQGQQLARHELATSGQVTEANDGLVTIRQQNGTLMSFQVTGTTQVLVDGQRSVASALQPGEDAHVAYRLSGTEPAAVQIQAVSGNPQAGAAASGSPPTGTGGSPPSGTTGGGTGESAGGPASGTGSGPSPNP